MFSSLSEGMETETHPTAGPELDSQMATLVFALILSCYYYSQQFERETWFSLPNPVMDVKE